MGNTEAAQSPHRVGNNDFRCPEDEMEILFLAVPPFSGTWAAAAWLLTASPMLKAVSAGLVCGVF